MQKQYWVYIVASQKNGTLYIGITSDLIKRIYEHKNKLKSKFTAEYNVNSLVYYVEFADPENAIRHEKRLKKYNRQWKINLIEEHNPEWKDLYDDITG